MNPTRPNTRWLEIGLMTAGLTLLGSWMALFGLAGTEGDARRAVESRGAGPGSDEHKTYIGAVLYRPVGRGTRIEIPGAGISARIAEGAVNRTPTRLLGERNPMERLTTQCVRRIRARRRRGETFAELAARFEVHRSTAWKAYHGHTWGWLL